MTPIYRLYVCIAGQWELECAIESADPESAFSEALRLVTPEHANLALRFEVDSKDCKPASARRK